MSRKEGYDSVSFYHPSTYSEDGFKAIVPFDNNNIKIIDKQKAKQAKAEKASKPKAAKAPWEMTKTQFNKKDSVGHAKDVKPGNEYKAYNGKTYVINDKNMKGLGYGINFYDKETKEQFSGNVGTLREKVLGGATHRGVIYNALKNGDKVPASVLKDYPDLAPETKDVKKAPAKKVRVKKPKTNNP